jgi:hypothetical protein|tara:strand:+ start:2569 stop:3189 length:621 start_codon:yes stop_codon:yes gene_type:complete
MGMSRAFVTPPTSGSSRRNTRVKVFLPLVLAFACVTRAVASADLPLFDITSESPGDHLLEVMGDADSLVDAGELKGLFQSIQNKISRAANAASAAADPHAGHGHAQEAVDTEEITEATHVMSAAQIIAKYGTADGGYLDATQVRIAFPKSRRLFAHTRLTLSFIYLSGSARAPRFFCARRSLVASSSTLRLLLLRTTTATARNSSG